MATFELIATIIGGFCYAWNAARWATYLRSSGGFVPAAAIWPVLQAWVWIKGDLHKRGSRNRLNNRPARTCWRKRRRK
jgi:hypothetical protein